MGRGKRRPSLTALFVALNASHFGGRLPAFDVRRLPFSILRAAHRAMKGLPEFSDRLGYCNAFLHEIRIAPRLTPEGDRCVLLHEMAHAATVDEDGQSHGPQWRAEMYRLADECGETWAAAHARKYEPRNVPASECEPA